MESKSVVKIDTYESNNKTITLNNIYYDYVKGIIYQINKDKVNVYKPRNHHFVSRSRCTDLLVHHLGILPLQEMPLR